MAGSARGPRPMLAKLHVPQEEASNAAGSQNRTLTTTSSIPMRDDVLDKHLRAVRPEDLVPGEMLGRGQSSYVQKAMHLPSAQPLALKVINFYDKSKREQLIREINTLYDCDCDCLLGFHGAFSREGTIVLALEYMDAGSLQTVASTFGPIPEPVLAGVAFQLFWGLAYLRVEKRLHRDLKPGNLLVSTNGAVKLADFGLSAELANSIGMAQTYLGTCKYMAPERIAHSGYSFPADIWSAGLVLLEAATGEFPMQHAAGSYIEMAMMILEAPDSLEVPVGAVGAGGVPLSDEFKDFIVHCLRKNPDNRWSAEALLTHPWLAKFGITGLQEATEVVKAYLQRARGPSSQHVPSAGEFRPVGMGTALSTSESFDLLGPSFRPNRNSTTTAPGAAASGAGAAFVTRDLPDAGKASAIRTGSADPDVDIKMTNSPSQ